MTYLLKKLKLVATGIMALSFMMTMALTSCDQKSKSSDDSKTEKVDEHPATHDMAHDSTKVEEHPAGEEHSSGGDEHPSDKSEEKKSEEHPSN